VSSAQPPGRPRSSRLALAASLAGLVLVVLGFSWIAVKSFEFIHTGIGASNLKAVKITGPQETVFRWQRDRCDSRDVPDVPARAYRDAAGTVHLFAAHYVTRQWTGPDLNHVRHDCRVVMKSAYDRRPSRYTDKEWITAPYTLDGKTVYALIHDEYHGNEFPGLCPSGNYLRCWYNAITLARSSDSGNTFEHALQPPAHLVAELPYRYQPDAGSYGVFQPSNIVQRDGYYYSLVYTQQFGLQKAGTCVIRTNRLADPTSWRAWDGGGYNIAFIDPYRVRADPGKHVCEPVSKDEIGQMTQSLTYNTYFGKYLLVSPASDFSGRKRRVVWGFYYSVSGDLIHWSRRKLIREAELPYTYHCGDPDPVFYPSVLDPNSTSRNFETTGRRPYLYFTRLHYKGCIQTMDRDLVRIPIEFSK
jgi:hypothetical protein